MFHSRETISVFQARGLILIGRVPGFEGDRLKVADVTSAPEPGPPRLRLPLRLILLAPLSHLAFLGQPLYIRWIHPST